jgi:hypothetical protein
VPPIVPDAALIVAMEDRLTLHQLDLADNETKLELCRRNFGSADMDLAVCRSQLYRLGYNFQTRTTPTPLGDDETARVALLLSIVNDLIFMRTTHLHTLHNFGRMNKDIRWDIMKLEETMVDYKAMIEEAEKERKENEGCKKVV